MATSKIQLIKLALAFVSVLFLSCGKKSEGTPKSNVTNAISNSQNSESPFFDLRKIENRTELSENDKNDIIRFVDEEKRFGKQDFTPTEIPQAMSLSDSDIELVSKLLREQSAIEMCELLSFNTVGEKNVVFALVHLQCLTTRTIYCFAKPKAGNWKLIGNKRIVH